MTNQREVKQYIDEEKQQEPSNARMDTEEEKTNWEMI